MPSTFLKKKNNAYSTLLSTITNSQTTIQIQVSDASKFPSSGNFMITVWYSVNNIATGEIMEVTATSGNTFTVIRAQEGTGAQAFNVSTGTVNVQLEWTAGQASEYENCMDTGWVPVQDIWTYLSSNSVTVPSDATTIYSSGDKIRFQQGSGYKYYYVSSVTATTLTLSGGTDYTVANSGITSVGYSKSTTPVGFPEYFNYSPTLTGFSLNPTFNCRFYRSATNCNFYFYTLNTGTSNSTSFTMTLPFPAENIASLQRFVVWIEDNGTAAFGVAQTQQNSTTLSLFPSAALGSWTSSGTKFSSFSISYATV